MAGRAVYHLRRAVFRRRLRRDNRPRKMKPSGTRWPRHWATFSSCAGRGTSSMTTRWAASSTARAPVRAVGRGARARRCGAVVTARKIVAAKGQAEGHIQSWSPRSDRRAKLPPLWTMRLAVIAAAVYRSSLPWASGKSEAKSTRPAARQTRRHFFQIRPWRSRVRHGRRWGHGGHAAKAKAAAASAPHGKHHAGTVADRQIPGCRQGGGAFDKQRPACHDRTPSVTIAAGEGQGPRAAGGK